MTAISVAELKRYLSFVSATVIQVYQCTYATVWKLFTVLKLSAYRGYRDNVIGIVTRLGAAQQWYRGLTPDSNKEVLCSPKRPARP